MGIELRKHSGPFWEQSLSKLLYAAVDEDFDFVLTMDYDSVYRPHDVQYMLNLMVNTPEAAVIFPVQYRRESSELLLGVSDCKEGTIQKNRLAGHLLESTVGHFGLTLIRVSALKQIPHPWLHSQPGPSGKWDDERCDADVGFWHKLTAAGFKMFCATRCVVGHLQQVITWPGEGYDVTHQYIGQYFGDGDAPPEVIKAASKRATTNGVNGHATSEVSRDQGPAIGNASAGDLREGQDL